METCPHCGIQRESGYSECPLCKNRYYDDQVNQAEHKTAYPGLGKPLTGKEKNNLLWELSVILYFSSMVVLFFIDLILNNELTWSRFAVAGITASFIYSTLIVFSRPKPWFLLTGILLNTCGLLFAIDMLPDGRLDWFLIPALPLAAFLILFIGLVLLFTRKTKNKGLNIIAFSTLASGAYIVVIDLCVSWVKHHHLAASWSVVVAVSILPFALFLLYFHYRLKRGTSLRKFFHL